MVLRKSGMNGKQQTPAKQKGKKTAEEDNETFFDMNSEEPTKRSAEDDSDDDDDDDEDADLDMLLGGGDDDDEEEEEEEDDDNGDEDDNGDDDDNDDEDSLPTKKQNANQKQQIKKEAATGQKKTSKKEEPKSVDKTPKGADKTKNIQAIKGDKMQKAAESPAKVSPKKNEKKEASDFQKAAIELGDERKRERDAKTLFIGNLPKGVSAEELKALSSDILSVNIPLAMNKSRHLMFAFLEFLNEAKAEDNYKIFLGKKFRGVPISVDFTGHKSKKNITNQSENKTINMKKLFISSLFLDVTIAKIAQFFPKAVRIFLNKSPVYRCASVFFANEKDAAEALETSKSAKIDGTPLTAVYSSYGGADKKRKRNILHIRKHSSYKKMKFEG